MQYHILSEGININVMLCITLWAKCWFYLQVGLRPLHALSAASPPKIWAKSGSLAHCCIEMSGNLFLLCSQHPRNQRFDVFRILFEQQQDAPYLNRHIRNYAGTFKTNAVVPVTLESALTWHACARLIPTLKRADIPGGREMGSAPPKPGSITWRHLTTASTISSLVNCFKLSIFSPTSLRPQITEQSVVVTLVIQARSLKADKLMSVKLIVFTYSMTNIHTVVAGSTINCDHMRCSLRSSCQSC